MTYVMNYYHLHRIEPQSCNILLKTDTVQVDKMISLNSVSHVLSIDLNHLTILNPSYPRMLVNGSPSSPKTLVIPAGAKAKYIGSYDLLNSELAPLPPASEEEENRMPARLKRKYTRHLPTPEMNPMGGAVDLSDDDTEVKF